jgi:SAM-dependent methyltransferase
MLAVARAKPGAESIEWVNAGLGDRLDDGFAAPAFDAAGCFYDTLNHLRDTADLARALSAIAAALRPGGLLVFDVTNEEGFAGWWRGRRTWRGTGWRVAVEMAYDPARREGAASVTVDRGAAETTSAILIERCFAAGEWQAALAGAGMELVAASRWNPFPDDALGKTWVISRKKLP